MDSIGEASIWYIWRNREQLNILHQESEYQEITDDDNYQKNKKKKPNKKEDWSDKALEEFLETLREQPVKEMNDRRNKCIMFCKCLKGTKKKGNDEEPLKKGKKGSLLSQKPIPLDQYMLQKQVFTINSLEDVKGVWAMHTRGNPECATAIVHKITLFKLKIVIIIKHFYFMYFEYGKMMRIFQKYIRQTGASGNISAMKKKIVYVFSGLKHVEADIVGSSSGSGILNSGNKITLTKLLLFVRSKSGAQCCVPVHACLY